GAHAGEDRFGRYLDLVVLVVAFGEIHRADASTPQFANQAIRSLPLERRRGIGLVKRKHGGLQPALDETLASRAVAFQQRCKLVAHLGVGGVDARYPGGALRGRDVEGLVKEFADLAPALRRHSFPDWVS